MEVNVNEKNISVERLTPAHLSENEFNVQLPAANQRYSLQAPNTTNTQATKQLPAQRSSNSPQNLQNEPVTTKAPAIVKKIVHFASPNKVTGEGVSVAPSHRISDDSAERRHTTDTTRPRQRKQQLVPRNCEE